MPRLPLSHRIRRDAIVIALAERDGDRCWYCGCTFGDREDGGGRTLTIDHVEPVADGGASSLENLRLCCSTKGRMGADAYAASELLDRRRRHLKESSSCPHPPLTWEETHVGVNTSRQGGPR